VPASTGTALGPAAVTATPSSSVPATPRSSLPVRAPVHAAVQTPVSLEQARAIAERIAGGRADKVEAEAGGIYDVSVVRVDGSEAQLVIDARTGRVISNAVGAPDAPDTSELGQAEPAEPADVADPSDG
jgi:uncharacterized membrane protein YkoI